MTIEQILDELRAIADPEKLLVKEAKFGIISDNALGIYQKDLQEIAKKIPKEDALAIQLFDSGIYEAKLLCSLIFNPRNLTQKLMEQWTGTFENWEICDSFSMRLFAKSNHATTKAVEWSTRTREFEKRAGFATIAALCMADKESSNETFEQFLLLVSKECTDERLYVKKSVNWALRNIGKRNVDLRLKAIEAAEKILHTTTNKTATWIANNALKELKSDKVRVSNYPRKIYA